MKEKYIKVLIRLEKWHKIAKKDKKKIYHKKVKNIVVNPFFKKEVVT